MAVKSPNSLEQQVDRRQVADHQVEVHVEGLFDDLCSDDNSQVRPLACSTELGDQPSLQISSVLRDESRMDQSDGTGEVHSQGTSSFLRASHRIPNDPHTPTVGQISAQSRHQAFDTVVEPFDPDNHRWGRRFDLNHAAGAIDNSH
jgi:hypothetical protein